MKNKVVSIAKWIISGIVICVAFAMAGRMDYEDHVLTEMKNNGTYATMCEMHPDWSEHQIVEAYVSQK